MTEVKMDACCQGDSVAFHLVMRTIFPRLEHKMHEKVNGGNKAKLDFI